ncbi:Membrane protein mosC [Pseudomonas synxantha]|uniref:Membrane protein mosC n=1 Tax=Pseudomonas synxantha TaxID=47883 RepID=A0A3G7U7A8_9PSED|nr:Membrane protein mosC [Pseudomonas synxantha]
MTMSSLAINTNYRERTSTRIAFLIAGLVMSAWAPLVPLAKARTCLDESGLGLLLLGLLLLGLGVGSIVAMPFAGHLTARYGCRPVIVCSTATLCVLLVLLSSLSWLPGLYKAIPSLLTYGTEKDGPICIGVKGNALRPVNIGITHTVVYRLSGARTNQ